MSYISELLLDYDNDEQIPIYGFGAIPKFPDLKSNTVQHCFPVTGDPNHVSVCGIENIISAYKNSLKYVELSQPTLFDPLI